VFKLEPHELVAGTKYPRGKAERLPLVAARHTEVELALALLDNDLGWCDVVAPSLAVPVLQQWQSRIGLLVEQSHDRRERDALADAARRVGAALDAALAR
ncbi:MAG: hypothetical protein U0P45_17400, partial [Acidimicrobiales bacterium]